MQLKKEWFYFLAIFIGLAVRLIWTNDMEWKDDEKDMYRMAQETVQSGTLPTAGMRSGGGLVNPGLSVAPFALIATFTEDPVAMNRMVQIVNVLAICFFLLFIIFELKGAERELWLAGLTLAAVSPLAVLFSRKIWAQDMLPLVSFLIVWARHYRHKALGAFFWGLFGAIIGQIHMSGFFYAAGIFVCSVIYDYYNGIKFKWFYWILGSLIGSITLVTWIMFVLQNPQVNRQSFWHILTFNFYIHWFIDSTGINLYYSLREHFWEYIREPLIGGMPTWIVTGVHLFLVYTAWLVLVKIYTWIKIVYQMIRSRITLARLFTSISLTRFYMLSLLFGLGILLTLSGVIIHPHYLICALPFQYIFVAKVFETRPALFRCIVVAQLFLTLTFLFYIHRNNGAPNGDYGRSYIIQLQESQH